jgi:hypothetical protein
MEGGDQVLTTVAVGGAEQGSRRGGGGLVRGEVMWVSPGRKEGGLGPKGV